MSASDAAIRDLLTGAFHAAVAAVSAARLIPGHLPPPGRGRTLVVGAGNGTDTAPNGRAEHVGTRGRRGEEQHRGERKK